MGRRGYSVGPDRQAPDINRMWSDLLPTTCTWLPCIDLVQIYHRNTIGSDEYLGGVTYENSKDTPRSAVQSSLKPKANDKRGQAYSTCGMMLFEVTISRQLDAIWVQQTVCACVEGSSSASPSAAAAAGDLLQNYRRLQSIYTHLDDNRLLHNLCYFAAGILNAGPKVLAIKILFSK